MFELYKGITNAIIRKISNEIVKNDVKPPLDYNLVLNINYRNTVYAVYTRAYNKYPS